MITMRIQLQRRDEISPGCGNDHRAGRITVTPPRRHPSCRRRDQVHIREWPSRDPVAERGGLNLLAFAGNELVNMVDNLRLKLSKDGGAKAINDELSSLQAACDKRRGFFHCCSKKHCNQEAAQLVQLLADAWKRNYGSGPHDDNAPGSDTVGGYFCWDWATIFQNAASSTKFKCFSFEIGMAVTAATPQGTPVHYYLEVYACKRHKDKFRISFDDGFYGGDPYHTGPFPPPGGPYDDTNPPWPVPPGRGAPFTPAPTSAP